MALAVLDCWKASSSCPTFSISVGLRDAVRLEGELQISAIPSGNCRHIQLDEFGDDGMNGKDGTELDA